MNKLLDTVKNFFADRKGKTVAGAVAAVLVIGVAAIIFASTHRPVAAVAPASTSADSTDSVPFASAPAIDSSSEVGSSSNPLSVNVNTSSSKQPSNSSASKVAGASRASSSTISTATKPSTSSWVPKTGPTHVSTSSTPVSVPSHGTSSSTAQQYKGYTDLDMTDFSIGTLIYGEDPSVSNRFENPLSSSSNLPKDKYGDFVIDLAGPAELYARGQVSIDQLKQVLMNDHKYVGGGDYKYIVTGVYDNSRGLTYKRSQLSTAISQVYAQGFVNNPYSNVPSYSDGALCIKISDGGSAAKGYVRAVVFTLKKIS